MKVIKQLMKNMGVGRRRSSNGASSSSPSKEFFPSRKRRATIMTHARNSTATDETSLRSLTSLGSNSADKAPWRVESIRMEAPEEADWWKHDDAVDSEDEATYLMSSSGVSDSLNDSTTSQTAATTTTTTTASTGSRSATTASTGSRSDSTPACQGFDRKFHNCGLETWEAARAAWTAKPTDTLHSSTKSKSKTSQKELGRILTKASSLRTYDLPRRTPLKDLVESYVTVWNGSDDM